MADRPILFTAPMIRALIREISAPGTGKTQTRRIMRLPTRTASGGPIYERPDMGGWEPTTHGGGKCFTCGPDGLQIPVPEMVGMWHRTTGVGIVTPHQAGDRLWVRETWAHYHTINHIRRTHGGAFSEVSDGLAGYRADGHDSIDDFREHIRLMSGCDLEAVEINGSRWRPSIHMPRWASRLTLYVSEVRVERLQDISEADAIAEGVECDSDGWRDYLMPQSQCCSTARDSYRSLWDSLNGPGAWEANSWVAAYTFAPRLGNIDTLPATIQEAA
ncbi:hypothetical protein V5F38_05350 [Xanthobacter sp. V0B-10]|uniref:hypothetical protein n=1 Tax=Xanthobacter albus TaxID=3119929 RepID=UPI003726B872